MKNLPFVLLILGVSLLLVSCNHEVDNEENYFGEGGDQYVYDPYIDTLEGFIKIDSILLRNTPPLFNFGWYYAAEDTIDQNWGEYYKNEALQAGEIKLEPGIYYSVTKIEYGNLDGSRGPQEDSATFIFN